jgi:hypothetical protein
MKDGDVGAEGDALAPEDRYALAVSCASSTRATSAGGEGRTILL